MWERISDTVVEVTELPIGMWTQNFKVPYDAYPFVFVFVKLTHLVHR